VGVTPRCTSNLFFILFPLSSYLLNAWRRDREDTAISACLPGV
jgi:hypothetical protein